MKLRHLARTAVFVVALAAPARAQQRLGPPPGPAFALFRPAPTLPPVQPASFIHSAAPDYRWEGLTIGAIAVGTFFGVVALEFCGDPDSGRAGHCAGPGLEGFLVGATVGGIIGVIVGTFIPKPTPNAQSGTNHGHS